MYYWATTTVGIINMRRYKLLIMQTSVKSFTPWVNFDHRVWKRLLHEIKLIVMNPWHPIFLSNYLHIKGNLRNGEEWGVKK
jgi:hypothetical protein